jgi:hypothetical protein
MLSDKKATVAAMTALPRRIRTPPGLGYPDKPLVEPSLSLAVGQALRIFAEWSANSVDG